MKKYPLLVYVGDVYRPSNDSWLLMSLLDETNPHGDLCLDLGAGSGILGLYALLNNHCERVVFVDVHEDAAETVRANIELNRVVNTIILLSDDVALREGSVEIVLANPPYLPIQDSNYVDIATEGGVKGYETVLYFIEYASRVLTGNGLLYIVYSSFTNPDIVLKQLEISGFSIKYTRSKDFFIETIYGSECVKTW